MIALLQEVCYLVLLFFVVSVFGWIMEVTLKLIQYHRFINRGFLAGPYCPIYGFGVVFITVMVRLVSGVETSIGTTFLISFVGCGVLEYCVSYVMEKRFHARWWDYSNKPMNLHGRIWIGNLLLFGIGGCLVVEFINPLLFPLFQRLSPTALYIIAAAIVVLMLTDYIFSHFIMKLVKVNVENSEADNTEQLGKEIRLLMSDKSVFHRRLVEAYPEVTYYTERIMKRKQEREERLDQIRKSLTYNYELLKKNPLTARDELIHQQAQLIALLSDSSADQAEIAKLQEAIAKSEAELSDQNRFFRLK